MVWSYNPAQLPANTTFQVRLLIGDTVQTDQQFQDEEIVFTLSKRASIYGAAADLCRALASKFSRKADTMDRDMRTQYSAIARNYLSMANSYSARASSASVPYAGGISVSDKQQQEQNPDRVQPAFNVGMQDNYIPVPDAGNEPGSASSGGPSDGGR